MGRIKQPRELAELSGAVRKIPQRYRKVIPKHPEPLGDPPDHLTADEKAAWHEIAGIEHLNKIPIDLLLVF